MLGALGILWDLPLSSVLDRAVGWAGTQPLGTDDRRKLKEYELEGQENAMKQHRVVAANEQHSMQCWKGN